MTGTLEERLVIVLEKYANAWQWRECGESLTEHSYGEHTYATYIGDYKILLQKNYPPERDTAKHDIVLFKGSQVVAKNFGPRSVGMERRIKNVYDKIAAQMEALNTRFEREMTAEGKPEHRDVCGFSYVLLSIEAQALKFGGKEVADQIETRQTG